MAKSAISRLPEQIAEPTIGDMLAIDNITAGETMHIPFELLVGGKVLIPNRNETDQGITGNSKSIKACVDAIGSDTGTIYLRHSSGSAQTIYNLTTDVTIPSNITFKREPGAIIDGTGKLTIVGIIGDYDRGQYFGPNLTVELTPASLHRFLFPESWLIDGVADQIEINKALECAHTADTGYGGAADVILSSGKRYNATGAIRINHSFVNLVAGLSSWNAVIHRTMTTGNSLEIQPANPASSLIQRNRVQGLTFYQTVNVPTADAHIRMESASGVQILDCFLVDGYHGIHMLGGNDCKFESITIKGSFLTTGTALHAGIKFSKGSGSIDPNCSALSIHNLRIEQDFGSTCYAYGIDIQGADGIWIYDSHIIGGGIADVYINPASGNHCAGVYFIGCYFEWNGVLMDTTHNATYSLFQFKNCFHDGEGITSDNGLKITSTCNANGIQIHGCQMFNWGDNGVRVESTLIRNLSIQANQIYDCDKNGGGAAGISLLDGVTDFSIIGNQVGDETGGGSAKSIVCGTAAGAGVSNCIISDNKCQHNTDDQIYVYGTEGIKMSNNLDGVESDQKNILINQDFQIWQENTTFTNPASNDYTADGYYVQSGAGGGTLPTINVKKNAAVYENAYGQTLELEITNVGAAGTTRAWGVRQKIPNYEACKGKTVCFSIRVKSSVALTLTDGSIYINDGVGSTSFDLTSLTSSWATLSVRHAVSTSATGLFICFAPLRYGTGTISTTGSIYIQWMKLEKGQVITPITPKSKSDALIECMPFYQKSYAEAIFPGAVSSNGQEYVYSSGHNNADHTVISKVSFPVAMDGSPTITLYSPSNGTSGNVDMDAGVVGGTITDSCRQGFSGYGTNGAASVNRMLKFHWVAVSRP